MYCVFYHKINLRKKKTKKKDIICFSISVLKFLCEIVIEKVN